MKINMEPIKELTAKEIIEIIRESFNDNNFFISRDEEQLLLTVENKILREQLKRQKAAGKEFISDEDIDKLIDEAKNEVALDIK